jgi:uncharacterized protein (DUF362 family)
MKIHPLLNDPEGVFVYSEAVPEIPAHTDYARIAQRAMEIMQVELADEKAVLKPNVTSGEHFADPENGITTHPAFVGGIVDYLFQHGAKPGGVYIVEDPRDSDDFNPRHWKDTGYVEIAKDTGAKLRCPNSYYCIKKAVPNPLVHPIRSITRYADDSNSVLINVPKMKTHNVAITTLCIKNLMGLDDVFDRHYCGQAWKDLPADRVHAEHEKNQWMDEQLHELWQTGLAKRLVDLAQVIHPDLNIVEGVIGRDGTGFNRGRNFPLGMVIAGINPVSVDSVTSYIMGFNPLNLIYLKMAKQAGLGQNDPRYLHIYTVDGDKITPCSNIESIRTKEPFKVIRDIIGDC